MLRSLMVFSFTAVCVPSVQPFNILRLCTPCNEIVTLELPVLYVMTHDSIFIGEDYSTHQPIETVSSLRAIPNMQVLRPEMQRKHKLPGIWQLTARITLSV